MNILYHNYDVSSVRKLSTFFTNCTLSFTNHSCLLWFLSFSYAFQNQGDYDNIYWAAQYNRMEEYEKTEKNPR